MDEKTTINAEAILKKVVGATEQELKEIAEDLKDKAQIVQSPHTDEIALNPQHFLFGAREVVGTLVHEMVHLWHKHFGSNPPKNGYHNKEWGQKMEEIGLIPSNTGAPGGKQTGVKMSHYIEKDGPFDLAFQKLEKSGQIYLYQDRGTGRDGNPKKKDKSKIKHTCPGCQMNIWGKEGIKVSCVECDEELVMEEKEE